MFSAKQFGATSTPINPHYIYLLFAYHTTTHYFLYMRRDPLTLRTAGVFILTQVLLSHGLTETQLGEPPKPPASVDGLPRVRYRIQQSTPTFSVDTSSREQVRNFYNAVYIASESVPMNSTADQANCFPGTNASAYYEATFTRINWFRAMAGVPPITQFDPTYCRKNQQAALVMSANGALSHYPPSDWSCWTQEAYEAAQNSNLALGSSGPDSITSYIWDFGTGNSAVGHRRWLLYPQTRIMGTGDVPKQGPYYAANATWVFDGHYFDPRPSTRTPYIAWPPPGYVPYTVVFPRWSISYPGADFSYAIVSMKSNGTVIAVSLEPVQPGYGENTLVWIPMDLDANSHSTTFPFNGTDTTYEVFITSIANAPFTSVNYTVTVFDPQLPGSDYVPLNITGPAAPVIGQPNLYSIPQIVNVTKYQWRHAKVGPTNIFDGAEAGLVNFDVATSSSYDVIQQDVKARGKYAFHLAHPEPADQILTLKYQVIVCTNTVLSFQSRLGWATSNQIAKVQLSLDEGRTWITLYSQPGTGSAGELTFTTRSIPLTFYAGRTIHLRFNYSINYGSYYPQTSAGVGWYLDNILITNAMGWIEPPNIIATTTNSLTLTPSQLTQLGLQARALLFDLYPIEWGPVLFLTPAPPPPIIFLYTPTLSSNNVYIPFELQAGTATLFTLLESTNLIAGWSTNTQATLISNNNTLVFVTPSVGPLRFYRILAH